MNDTPPIISLLLLLPGLAVLARRLHDTDRSGWWWLLCFTVIGVFVVLYWLCLEGTRGTNRFGPRTTLVHALVRVHRCYGPSRRAENSN